MKNLLFMSIIVMIFLSSSCKKSDDLSNSDDLSGTSWISGNMGTTSQPGYIKLIFISKTTVQLWYKDYPDVTFTMDSSATYTITGNNIIINYGDGIASGVIDGNTMTIVDSGETVKFTKQ